MLLEGLAKSQRGRRAENELARWALLTIIRQRGIDRRQLFEEAGLTYDRGLVLLHGRTWDEDAMTALGFAVTRMSDRLGWEPPSISSDLRDFSGRDISAFDDCRSNVRLRQR